MLGNVFSPLEDLGSRGVHSMVFERQFVESLASLLLGDCAENV